MKHSSILYVVLSKFCTYKLNIPRMVMFSIEKSFLVVSWSYQRYMCTINTTQDTRKPKFIRKPGTKGNSISFSAYIFINKHYYELMYLPIDYSSSFFPSLWKSNVPSKNVLMI